MGKGLNSLQMFWVRESVLKFTGESWSEPKSRSGYSKQIIWGNPVRHLYKLFFRYTPVNWRSFMNYMTLNDIKLCHLNMLEIMNIFPGQ